MKITIEFAPRLEDNLRVEAHLSGISPEEIVKKALEKRFRGGGGFVGYTEPRDFTLENKWLRENREKYQGKHIGLKGSHLNRRRRQPNGSL